MNDEVHPDCALGDLLVLDLSRDLAAPLVGQIMGDLGALVIKVEHPVSGDESRDWGPPFVGAHSVYYLAFNRNKRAMTLDLKHPQGQAIARELVCRADVLIENFRGETAARLGISPEAVQALNPRAIHLTVSGFGRTGSAGGRPGYDLIMQGLSGLMSITGSPDGPPTRMGLAIVDILTGLYGATAVLAALHDRERSGQGQWIDLALHDAAIATLANVSSAYLNTGREPGRYGNAHPNLVPYQPFATADGQLVVAVANDAQWRRFCRALGLDTLAEDARFATNSDRVRHRDALLAAVEPVLLVESTAHWEEQLRQADVPVSSIRSVPAALADPLVAERGLVWEGIDAAGLLLRLPGSPLAHLSRTPARLDRLPPSLGEDTDWVLARVLGYDEARIAELRADHVIK